MNPTKVSTLAMSSAEKPFIVFFDGVCGLCNRFIDFLFWADRRNKLKFAPLQGDTAKSRGIHQESDEMNTIIYQTGENKLEKSDAVLQILWDIGGIWRLSACASNSFQEWPEMPFMTQSLQAVYKWFGKRETCRMPTADEKEKLLT